MCFINGFFDVVLHRLRSLLGTMLAWTLCMCASLRPHDHLFRSENIQIIYLTRLKQHAQCLTNGEGYSFSQKKINLTRLEQPALFVWFFNPWNNNNFHKNTHACWFAERYAKPLQCQCFTNDMIYNTQPNARLSILKCDVHRTDLNSVQPCHPWWVFCPESSGKGAIWVQEIGKLCWQ